MYKEYVYEVKGIIKANVELRSLLETDLLVEVDTSNLLSHHQRKPLRFMFAWTEVFIRMDIDGASPLWLEGLAEVIDGAEEVF